MIGNLNLFSILDKLVQTNVTLRTNIQVTVLGKGTLRVLTKKGEKKTMSDVYSIKVLKQNLISIAQLLQNGYKVYMEGNHFVIRDICPTNQLIERVQMKRNHFFPLRIRTYMKENTNQVVHEGKNENSKYSLKVERKEVDKNCDKEERGNAKI